MANDLQELEDRIKWARSEIETVVRDLDVFMRDHIRVTILPTSGPCNDMVLILKGSVPVHISARSGIIANELRACLDGLASVLAERNNRSANGVYFPIVASEADLDSDNATEKIRKLSEADKQTVRDWRPFAVAKDGSPGNILLYGLHQADIKRKHHRLVISSTGGKLQFVEGRIGTLRGIQCQLVEGPNKIAEVSKDTLGLFRFIPTFSYFEPDVLRGRSVVETLNEFADLVEEIVSSFKKN